MFSRCDLESVAHNNGVLRECDSMRCGRTSIKSKNRDKKREGDAERERESCSNVFGVRCAVLKTFASHFSLNLGVRFL